jgi:hypothetical protein
VVDVNTTPKWAKPILDSRLRGNDGILRFIEVPFCESRYPAIVLSKKWLKVVVDISIFNFVSG